jgi:8-oxo-dGTP diphosphatase
MIGIDGQHWVSPIHSAAILAGEPVNQEPEKIASVLWFSLDAPPSPLAQAATDAIKALGATPLPEGEGQG